MERQSKRKRSEKHRNKVNSYTNREFFAPVKYVHPCFEETTILSIEPAGLQDVWDIEVAEDHSYVAAGVLNHNSSSAPNLQNVGKSKELRSLIKARDGWSFVDCDFSGLELRILALLSGDEKMLKAFRDGVDLHSLTAANLFKMKLEDFEGVDYTGPDGIVLHYKGMDALKAQHPKATTDQTFIRSNRKERKRAKITNFAVLYGEGAKSLAEDLEVSQDEAQSYIDGWFQTYNGAAAYVNKLHAETKKTGKVCYSWGRYRNLPGIFSTDSGIQSSALRQCVNSPIQGAGADCLSYSLFQIQKRIVEEGLSAVAITVLEIHDQGVWEVRDDYVPHMKVLVAEEMRRAKPFLPVREGFTLEVAVGSGKNLADMV